MEVENKIKQILKKAVETSIITGTAYIKITTDNETKETELELLNPFNGCECEQ